MENKVYYFDNAATTWPKPEAVYTAVDRAFRSGGNPGRSGHQRTLAAERLLYDGREQVASFFGAKDPAEIIFALNATDALNMAIKGLVKQGDHVLFTPFEHNSVLRPLNSLAKQGMITLTEMPCSPNGDVDTEVLPSLFQKDTALVISTHASNVTGQILPVAEIASLAHQKGAAFLLDTAQTAGVYPVDVEKLQADMVVFTGHKGLLGPPGVGGLYIRKGMKLKAWREGGTGSRSHEVFQPQDMPDYLEAGTMNIPGIAGLDAGIRFILAEGPEKVRAHEVKLTEMLQQGLADIPGVVVYGPDNPKEGVAVVSFALEGVDCGDIGYILEEVYGILSRTGLHCAPLAHQCLGTFPQGTVRLSPGYFTKEEDVEFVLHAVKQIAGEAGLD